MISLFKTKGQAEQDSIVKIDSTSVLIKRTISPELSGKYQDEAFNYALKTGESQNLMARFLNWIGQGLQRVFGITISPEVLEVMEFLIYILMGALAIFLIVKMISNERFHSIFTKKTTSFSEITLTEQHIETIDLGQLLNSALKEQNYRLAVRYQFLKVLQQLSQENHINWHYEKTNSDYYQELKKQELKIGFKKAAYLYEHIWYGEQTIDETIYKKTQNTFNNLNKI